MTVGLATLMEEDDVRACLLRLKCATRANWATTLTTSITSLEEAVQRHATRLFDRALSKADADLCGARLWRCLTYHLNRGGEGEFESLKVLILTCEQGKLFPGHPENLVADVILAEALQQGQNRAAQYFQERFMPLVRKTAKDIGKERAVIEIENYMADLYLHRDDSSSRISTYKGHTPLKYWLRTVVTNDMLSRNRRKKSSVPIDDAPVIAAEPAPINIESGDCRALLEPLLSQVVNEISAESRLLLKLLLVDIVPQSQVARTFDLNPGNITRRRNRAVAEICTSLQTAAAARQLQSRVNECLCSVLAGEDAELTYLLGTLVAKGLKGDVSASEVPR